MEKETSLKHLTYASLMIGINIVFILVNLYLPVFSLLILIGVVISTVLTLFKTNLKYCLLYSISSILICSLFDFTSTLTYLFPSLISGLIFSLLIIKKVDAFHIIIVTSLINIITESLIILCLNAILNVNVIDVFTNTLKISLSTFNEIWLSLLFIYTFAQAIFTYLILDSELHKFNYKFIKKKNIEISLLIEATLLLLLGWIFYYTSKLLFNITIILNTIISIYLIYILIKKHIKILNFLYIVTYILSIIILFIFNRFFINNGLNLIFGIFCLSSTLNAYYFLVYIIFIKKEKLHTLFNNSTENIK